MDGLLKQTEPIARKEHRCNFCGGVIKVGKKYTRQAIAADGTVYDFVYHPLCGKVAQKLTTYYGWDYEEGLDENLFCDLIGEYIQDKHLKTSLMTYPRIYDEGWDKITVAEAVIKIAKELNIT